MGRTVIKDFGDMARKRFDFQIHCKRCLRSVIIAERTLRLWREALRWGNDFGEVASRFPCQHCGPETVEWGFIRSGHGHPVLDLGAIALSRRDWHLRKARHWHELGLGRVPRRRG